MESLKDLQTRLGYTWTNPQLLTTALTHSSYAHAHRTKSYERLEFLGDSILDLVSAEFLMRKYPEAHEGLLSQERAGLVRASSLAHKAIQLGLDRHLIVRERDSYLRGIEKVLADVLEAIIGSIYIDSNRNLSVVARLLAEWGVLR